MVWKGQVNEGAAAAGPSRIRSGGLRFVECSTFRMSGGAKAVAVKLKQFATAPDKGGNICWENLVFPLPALDDLGGGILLVRKSQHCCCGYSEWAHRLGCTIVVVGADGYDGFPAGTAFFFRPGRQAFRLEPKRK